MFNPYNFKKTNKLNIKEAKQIKIPGLNFETLPEVDKQNQIKVKKFRFPRLKGMMVNPPKV